MHAYLWKLILNDVFTKEALDKRRQVVYADPLPKAPAFFISFTIIYFSLCNLLSSELSTKRAKRRCAERGNKKAKYYSLAAILYRVRFRSLSIETRGKPAATSLCFNLFIHHRGKRGAALNEEIKKPNIILQQRFYIASDLGH